MLFTNYQLKNLKLKNRIVMAPMCMYSTIGDGIATDWHLVHYLTRSVGQVGMIIIEATAIEPRGMISKNDLGLYDDSQIAKLKEIVNFAHLNNTVIGIQISHAGRKSVAGHGIIAPSNLAFSHYETPQTMTIEEIERTVILFKEAAQRALKAGFDFIEIHGAHGYLINQFLSPLTNQRNDKYGGSLENRSRFLQEIIKAVRSVWTKDKTLLLRISAEEYHPQGNHPQDVAKIINMVKDDIDMIDVSSGGVIDVKPDAYPGYQVKYSQEIKAITNIPTIAGGLMTTKLAQETLLNKDADLIYFGRELLRNPYFPLQAANELGYDLEWPSQYQRAK